MNGFSALAVVVTKRLVVKACRKERTNSFRCLDSQGDLARKFTKLISAHYCISIAAALLILSGIHYAYYENDRPMTDLTNKLILWL